MECPACRQAQPDGRDSCLRCGLIFARYRPRPIRATAYSELRQRMFPPATPASTPALLGRGLLLALLIWLSLPLILSAPLANASGQSFLHLVNLPFHEAGHLLFRPFGAFLTSLGGSIGQLLVPLVCLAAIWLKQGDAFGGAVCLWWWGENFLDLAPYINDARAGVMPLLGGNAGQTSPYGFHDWEFLLTETGLLCFDRTLAWLAHGWGAAVMLLALAWGGLLWWHQRSPNRSYK